ncbi:MAG TPA: hypothetical protein VGO75_04450, partial [Gemmatimonadaceae bacterium]|nr:hypothetical protein [Gemmatimonadaceae bacterium]
MSGTLASRSTSPSTQPGAERAAPEDRELDDGVALRESESHYRLPWTAGPDGATLDFSPRWLELTGLSRHQILSGEGAEALHP